MEGLTKLGPFGEALAEALHQTGARLTAVLPNVVASILIMLAGWAVSVAAGWIVRQTLRRLGLDQAADRVKIGSILRQVGLTGRPSAMVGRLVYLVVLLMFLVSAAETLHLTAVRSAADRVIAFVPDLVGAGLILLAGVVLAGFTRNLFVSAASAAGLLQAERIGAAVRALVVVVASVLSLDELGVDTRLLVSATTALIVVAGLSAGAAFAVGSRQVMTHILAGHYLRRTLPEGSAVGVRDRRGQVGKVGAVDTLLTDGAQSWTIPNAMLLEEILDR